MTSRDDIVIRPTLEEERAATPTAEREGRRVLGGRGRRRGAASARLLKSRAGRRMATRRATRRHGRPSYLRGASRFLFGPSGAVVAGLAITSAAAIRLATDKTFASMGRDLSHALYGHLDEQARATRETMDRLTADPEIVRSVGRAGGMGARLQQLNKALFDIRKQELVGEDIMRRAVSEHVNTLPELMLLEVKKAFESGFRQESGEALPKETR